MATLLFFPSDKIASPCRLTRPECDAVRARLHELTRRGHAFGMSLYNDGQFICVHDRFGAPYTIGREDGICSAFDAEETLIASSPHFADVLDALEAALMPAVPLALVYSADGQTAATRDA